MKKFAIITALTLFTLGIGETTCLADYADVKGQIPTELTVWLGGYAVDTDTTLSDGLAADYSLAETTGRVGSQKAAEYYSLENSPSGGFLFMSAPLPNRYHFEVDYFSQNDWYGDFRYSYLDNVLVRLMPRRMRHNLDNLTVFDFEGTAGNNTTDTKVLDGLVDDYGLDIDINQWKFRLKTPGYAIHLYSNGEIISRTGSQQVRSLEGSGWMSGLVRKSESRQIDQEKIEFSLGTTAHLGPVEIEIYQKNRRFESNSATLTNNYTAAGILEHHVIPKLEATTNTLRAHTSHTGRLSASATFTQLEKTNETSGVEAENTIGYGEVFWLPMSYLSLTTKFRFQKNEASTQSPTVAGLDFNGSAAVYNVTPGVESETTTASLNVKYSLIPKTTLYGKYTNKTKKVDEQSSRDWSTPPKSIWNIYEIGLTNWGLSKLRTSAKFTHTEIRTDLATRSINNNPEQSNKLNLGLTWMISPRWVAFTSANIAREDTEANSISGGMTDYGDGEALRQQYQVSLTYMMDEKLSLTPAYNYLSDEEGRDIVWGGLQDSNYTNKQQAHHASLSLMYVPTQKLSFNASLGFTDSEGSFDPTSPFTGSSGGTIDTDQIAQLSEISTEEITARLDTEYDLGRGIGLGLNLHYIDWKMSDTADNPSDGTFTSGLLILSYKIM